MHRWQKWLIVLGIMGGVLGVGIGVTRGDAHYTLKQLKKLWKEEAQEPLPPPSPELPKSERQQRAENAVQTLMDMCAMFQRPTLPMREFAEQFGTDIDAFDEHELTFQPHDPVFQQFERDYLRARVYESTTAGVYQVELNTLDEKQLTVADLERVFGKGCLRAPEGSDFVEFDWEPPTDGPMHCQISARLADRLDKPNPNVSIETIHLDRGMYDAEGGLWPAGMKVPPPWQCTWCENLAAHKAARCLR